MSHWLNVQRSKSSDITERGRGYTGTRENEVSKDTGDACNDKHVITGSALSDQIYNI